MNIVAQPASDPLADIRRFAATILTRGATVEVRALGVPGRDGGTWAGWFDEVDAMVGAIVQMDRRGAKGVYLTLNPAHRDLMARCKNRVRRVDKDLSLTGDADVLRRRWLPFDFDPDRISGVSATEEEHERALARAEKVAAWLVARGWPEPIRADSGNGAHLLFAVDLPPDDTAPGLVQRCLEVVALHFGGDGVTVDLSVGNAARIWRIYGTLNRKGENIPERPHRRSRLIALPDHVQPVPRALLEALAAEAPQIDLSAPQSGTDTRGWFNVEGFLDRHGLAARKSPWQGGWRWVLDRCPFSESHTDGAFVVQFSRGAVAAGCHHASCTWAWHDLRERLEPATRRVHRASDSAADDAASEALRIEDLPETGIAGSDVPIPDALWTGFFRAFRDWVAPTTDGALETVYAGAAVALGLAAGRSRAVFYGRRLFANVFALVVGPSGTVRKTTVVSRVLDLLEQAFPTDFVRVVRSIGSAEGFLEHFCADTGDALEGIPGQRVLFTESEFTDVLTKIGRAGTANVQDVLMRLYDGENVSHRTRRRPIEVVEPFLAALCTTTPENLAGRLDPYCVESGFLPRWSVFWAQPRDPIAYPDSPDAHALVELARHLQDRAQRGAARTLALNRSARDLWEELYRGYHRTLRHTRGVQATMVTRLSEQVMRSALLYALDRGHGSIERADLETASELGHYLQASAGALPQLSGRSAVDEVEQRVLRALSQVAGWVPASSIHRVVGGRIDAARLRQSLDALVRLGLIEERLYSAPRHPAVPVYRRHGGPVSHGHTVVGP